MVIYMVFADVDYETNRHEASFFKEADAKAYAEKLHNTSNWHAKRAKWDGNLLRIEGIDWFRYAVRQTTVQ